MKTTLQLITEQITNLRNAYDVTMTELEEHLVTSGDRVAVDRITNAKAQALEILTLLQVKENLISHGTVSAPSITLTAQQIEAEGRHLETDGL